MKCLFTTRKNTLIFRKTTNSSGNGIGSHFEVEGWPGLCKESDPIKPVPGASSPVFLFPPLRALGGHSVRPFSLLRGHSCGSCLNLALFFKKFPKPPQLPLFRKIFPYKWNTVHNGLPPLASSALRFARDDVSCRTLGQDSPMARRQRFAAFFSSRLERPFRNRTRFTYRRA